MSLFLLTTLAFTASGEPVQWRHEFNSAAIEAQNQNKPLFISIHTEWCGPCKEMHRTAMHDPTVVDLLNTKCIPLLLDGDRERDRMNTWRVSSYPTQIIVGTVGAVRTQVLERIEGKVGPSDLAAAVQRATQRQATAVASTKGDRPRDSKLAGGASKDASMRAPAGPLKPPPPSDADSVIKPAGFKTTEPASPKEAKTPLALDGNCPVCMIDRAEMVAGKPTESTIHDGRKYQFSSAENKRRFLESPGKYLPGAAGDCVVTLVETGKHVAGDTKFPAMFGDKVFFLADKSSREKFLKDPETYVTAKGEPKPAKGK